jgi:hypothetical protein
MELTVAANLLWSRKFKVATAFLLAGLVGVLMVYSVTPGFPPTFKSQSHYVGQASAQVLIDTPKSQIADLKPIDPNLLYSRASILADLVATAPVQQEVAEEARIPAAQLEVTPPPSSVIAPIRATPLAVEGTKAASLDNSWQLTVTIDPNLPIIAFSTVAPTAADAQRLATATLTVLQRHMGAIAASQHVPSTSRPVMNAIGPPLSASVPVGPRKLYGVAAFIVLFFIGCFLIVVTAGKAERLKAQEAELLAMQADGDQPGLPGAGDDSDTAFFDHLRTVSGAESEHAREPVID